MKKNVIQLFLQKVLGIGKKTQSNTTEISNYIKEDFNLHLTFQVKDVFKLLLIISFIIYH